MKKSTVIVALSGIIVIAGYALFLILTNKNDGNIEASKPEAQDSLSSEEKEGRQTEGTGETPQRE